MVETGLIPVVKTLGSWLLIPCTLLLAVLGFNFKKALQELVYLRLELQKVQISLGKLEIEIKYLKHDIEKIEDRSER